MKKILLTFGYHKSGHYSIVKALEEELFRQKIDFDTINLWEGKSVIIDQLFTIFRSFAAKGVKDVPDFLIDRELLDIFSEELSFDIDLNKYEAVISTHQYSTSVLAANKSKQNSTAVLIHVNANYTQFPLQIDNEVDFYTGMIPRSDSGADLLKKIAATGVPVRNNFFFDGRDKKKEIIILGGSDGFGEIEKIADFVNKIDKSYKIKVVCGNNIDVYNKIKSKYPDFNVFGYIDDLSDFFNDAEFVITKASGLSVAEALSCSCIPIFPPSILFWEDDAAKFIVNRGAGIFIPEFNDDAVLMINDILVSENFKHSLRSFGKKLNRPEAAKNIISLIDGKNDKIINSEQSLMIPDMKMYLDFFSNNKDLPKLSNYLIKQIKHWLKKYESNNSN